MKSIAPDEALSLLKPGMRIFLQGATGEPEAFSEAIEHYRETLEGVEIWACLLPGINTFDYGSTRSLVRLVTFMASPSLRRSVESGRTRVIELPYSQIARRLQDASFDLAILQLSSPDHEGRCGFSISCDFGPLVWKQARKTLAIINRAAPRLARTASLPTSAIDYVWDYDRPIKTSRSQRPRSPEIATIGAICAGLIPDGATVQSGLGEVPGAAIAALRDHRNLIIHTGMITPEYRDLAEAGALHSESLHRAGIAWGDDAFYRWLEATDMVSFHSADVTHDAALIGTLPAFHAVNSAVEVDLFGQANLQWRDGIRVSSIGGAPDFMAGSRISPGGRSIIALPSETEAGASRIVSKLSCPTISIPAHETDTIITEHGYTQTRGLDLEAKARALIALASPRHRETLEREWRDMTRQGAAGLPRQIP